jgi:hypothetical protein
MVGNLKLISPNSKAAPFIHNTFQAQVTPLMTDNMYKDACGASYDEWNMENVMGIGEETYKEFNYVIYSDIFLEMHNQLYLLQMS